MEQIRQIRSVFTMIRKSHSTSTTLMIKIILARLYTLRKKQNTPLVMLIEIK